MGLKLKLLDSEVMGRSCQGPCYNCRIQFFTTGLAASAPPVLTRFIYFSIGCVRACIAQAHAAPTALPIHL